MVWFGNLEKMVNIPAPLTEAGADMIGSGDIIQLGNGGAVSTTSAGAHREFTWSWIGSPDPLRIIKEFKTGVHGPGPFYWVDPFAAKKNLFAPNWAAPRVIDTGDWPDIYDTPHAALVDTPTNSWGLPKKSLRYALTATPNAVPARRFTIPIPPGHAFYLSAAGSRVGSGCVAVRPYLDGVPSTGDTFFYTPTMATDRWVSKADMAYSMGVTHVDVYLTRTSIASSSITLAALGAQLHPEGTNPTLPTAFMSGEGATGLRFAGPLTETYYTAGSANQPAKKGYAQKLVEAEAWEL